MTEQATRVFGALADQTRRDVLSLVASGDGATASALAPALSISRQAVAKHLVILEEAGLVTSDKRGRERVYVACVEPLTLAARYLVRLGAVWDQRLAGLRDLAESDE
jgi:DNA-binding transcriptional ArsR family regulator